MRHETARRGWPLLATLLTAASLATRPGLAQQPARNPHGPIAQQCATCHSSGTWRPATVSKEFRHAPETFPLERGHVRVACTSCHRSLEFAGTGTACASCHTDVHRGELGVECESCHTTRSFIDRSAMLRSHQTSRFPLVAGHLVADCESCHIPSGQGKLRFAGTPTTCDGCHRAEAAATKNPDHVAAGFVQACGQCHFPVAWNRARFDHTGTDFPLTGAHRSATCAQCHGDGTYAGRDPECIACHRAEYDATTNPPHTSTTFPTTCASCHGTSTWLGARFDHDDTFFPIFSGKHRGLWTGCATCHTNQADWTQFTCLTCHEHRQTAMDDKHHEIAGYRYESRSCYSCHPTGRDP